MSKIAQIFHRRSSPNKSASPDKSASLDRSTSNDTSTDPVLALKFKYFQDALGVLNQQYGDIQKIRTALEQSSYTEAQDKYKRLHDEIKEDRILKPEETKQLLFKIYESQAISAFRASEFKEHNTHLLHAYKNYAPGRDESIIGLERWVEIYKALGENAKDVPSISKKYNSLLEKVATEVQLLIKLGKHDQARAEMKYLNENSHNFQIFDLYFSTIKDPKEALKYFEDKSKNNLTQRQDINNILTKWQNHLSKQVNDKEVATTPVKKAVKKAGKDIEKLQEQLEKANLKLKTVITVDEQEKQKKELEAKYEAELEKLRTEHKAELEALKPKDSPTKDTKVGEAADFSPTSSLPPAYTSINSYPFAEVAKKIPTAPIAKPLAEEVLKELTKLANSITSVNHYEDQYKIDKDKAKNLLTEAVKENPDVYKTIDDPKILVLLADVLLSSNKMAEARIVCKKALDVDLNAWEATVEEIVLLNLAGVLLPSDQPKAEQIYSKVMNFRFICKNEQNTYVVDTNRKMQIAKIVAQDGYEEAERDCLAKFCLSSPKVYQKAQALDCYPHTDVTKRHEIALQLKQLGKQAPNPGAGEYKGYALYTKAFSVLKDDQILCQDMKKAYDSSCLYIDPTHFPYPPTGESTCYLLGLCASNESREVS